MASTKTRLGISAWAVTVFVLAFGSNGVRSLVGWPGFLGITAVVFVVSVALLVKHRPPRFKWYRVPKPLFAFLFLATASLLWSAYRLETALGVLAQLVTTGIAVAVATVLSWSEILRTLGTALRWLLVLSYAFELYVSVFVREPLLQGFVTVPDADKTPKLLFWSRNLLFEGGPIQGVVANSALLGFLGLLALIVFSVQLASGAVGKFYGSAWILVAAVTLLLTRAATVWVALFVVLVSLGFALWTRRVGDNRKPVYIVGLAGLAAAGAVGIWGRDWVFGLLGKSRDLTGRVEIWQKVTALAAERPWFGWGWISHWAPWVEPFQSLDRKAGLQVMHAHNAWLDVWLQLGWVGLAIFVTLALMTLQRVWCRAVDAPRRGAEPPLPYAASTLFPWLVMCALMVQSLTESRLLVEWGWLLFVVFAVKTRIDYELPSRADEPPRIPWRHVPIPREDRSRRQQQLHVE